MLMYAYLYITWYSWHIYMYTQKNNIYKYIKVYFHTSYYNILYINDHAGAVYIYKYIRKTNV
jgi:hypothetical protein